MQVLNEAFDIELVRKNIMNLFGQIENDRYIAGSIFSMADIYAYHIITWAGTYNIKIPPNVKNYLHILESRQACPPEIVTKH